MQDADLTAVRWHELALEHWLHQHFLLQEGIPVPVIIASPMDAYALYAQLWAKHDNPYRYLLELKDPETGAPLYQPYPQQPLYPLISVMPKGWEFRPQDNYSTHRRVVGYPTTSSNVILSHMGDVAVAQRPMAWTFNYQIDHHCRTKSTSARFIQALMKAFWRSQGQLQTWIKINFPDYWGPQYVRMTIPGNRIENLTPEEVPDGEVLTFRTSFPVAVEGYLPDINVKVLPTVWKMVLGHSEQIEPNISSLLFNTTYDLRAEEENPRLDNNDRQNVPPAE